MDIKCINKGNNNKPTEYWPAKVHLICVVMCVSVIVQHKKIPSFSVLQDNHS